MVAAKWFSEWYAFFGGEEMDVSRDDAATIWEAAIRAVEARQTQTNTGSPKLPTRADFVAWLNTFESAPSASAVYDWMCRQLRAGA